MFDWPIENPSQLPVWEKLVIVSCRFWNFFTIHVFEVRESFADIPTELPCMGDLRNSGHLPVQEVFEVIQTFVPWQKSSRFISSRAKVAGRAHDQRYVVNFIVMPLHVTSCYIMLRYATSCLVMSRHATLCHVMSRHVTSCHVMSRHVTSCHVTSRHVTSRHVTSCHVMSHHVTLCHVMSRRVSSKVAGRSHDQRFIVNWLFPHAINSI